MRPIVTGHKQTRSERLLPWPERMPEGSNGLVAVVLSLLGTDAIPLIVLTIGPVRFKGLEKRHVLGIQCEQ